MILEDILNDEVRNELNKIEQTEKKVGREKAIYRASEYTYIFKNFQTIKHFGRDIYNGEITLKEADKNQSNLLNEIRNFKERTKPQDISKNQGKEAVLINLYAIFEGREKVLDAFESKIFPIKSKGTGFLNFDHSKRRLLTPKQILQRLPIALAQVKASNSSLNLLNEIRKIVYQSKEITKKVYNNIIKSI